MVKKNELKEFVINNLDFFLKDDLEIWATETTGNKIQEIRLNILKLNSGPLGGDAQIASRVVEGKFDFIIFLRDPLDKHPHDSDITMLLRLCDVYNVPIATNLNSAKLLLSGLSTMIVNYKAKHGGYKNLACRFD